MIGTAKNTSTGAGITSLLLSLRKKLVVEVIGTGSMGEFSFRLLEKWKLDGSVRVSLIGTVMMSALATVVMANAAAPAVSSLFTKPRSAATVAAMTAFLVIVLTVCPQMLAALPNAAWLPTRN